MVPFPPHPMLPPFFVVFVVVVIVIVVVVVVVRLIAHRRLVRHLARGFDQRTIIGGNPL